MNKYLIANKALFLLPPHTRENFINYARNPYSSYEEDKKVIFVHIPKAAGKYVSKALLGAPNGTGHNRITYYMRDEKRFKSYFKFTFVRNPWDRLVSAFFYIKNFNPKSNDRIFFDYYIGQNTTFESFICKLADDNFWKLIRKWEHFTPQYEFICDGSGDVRVDFLGRYESLRLDIKKIAKKIGVNISIKNPINTSKHAPYNHYYSEETRKIVGHRYTKDISLLGYDC